MEGAQHHGAVDDGLGVEPGDDAGGGDHLGPGDIHIGGGVLGPPVPEQADPDPDHDTAAHQEDRHAQPFEALHDGADPEKAGEGKRDVKENDDESGEIGPAALLGEGGVDDEEVLQSDGGHVGQPHGEAL